MKMLRVLTGSHAGAQLALSDGAWRISAPADETPEKALLCITLEDWRSAPVSIRLADGIAQIQHAEGHWDAWPDLAPRRFGDTILCVGEDGTDWPADVVLLAPLLQSVGSVACVADTAASATPERRPWRWRGAMVAMASAGTLAIVIASPSQLPDSLPKDQIRNAMATASLAADTAEHVHAALAAARVAGLEASVEGSQVRVTGVLESLQDDARARAALLQFRGVAMADWQLVPELLDTLRSALHAQGATVRYLGQPNSPVVRGIASLLRDLHSRSADSSLAAGSSKDSAASLRAIQAATYGSGESASGMPGMSGMSQLRSTPTWASGGRNDEGKAAQAVQPTPTLRASDAHRQVACREPPLRLACIHVAPAAEPVIDAADGFARSLHGRLARRTAGLEGQRDLRGAGPIGHCERACHGFFELGERNLTARYGEKLRQLTLATVQHRPQWQRHVDRNAGRQGHGRRRGRCRGLPVDMVAQSGRYQQFAIHANVAGERVSQIVPAIVLRRGRGVQQLHRKRRCFAQHAPFTEQQCADGEGFESHGFVGTLQIADETS